MMKVFIADGSIRLCKQLITLLEQVAGIEIAGHAHTALETLAAINQLQPEVVVLDIHLAGGTGLSVLKKIKQETPPPVVITLTDYDYPQYRRRCLAAGADFLLNKSSDLKKLT